MELSAVPEALVTVCAASDKMKGNSKGKGEPAVSCSGRGKGRWRKPNSAKHLEDKLAARKANSTCHECGQRGHWAGALGCAGTRDTNFTTWSDERTVTDGEDNRAVMIVEQRFARSLCLYRFCSSLSVNSHQVWQMIISVTYLLSLALFLLRLQLNPERLVEL